MDNQLKKSPFKKEGMFNEANPLMFELAKNLRKNMTAAEMILWGHVKAGYEGIKFRRQHPLGIYIADFYCHKLRLIIEVDGNIHDKQEIKEYDIKHESYLINDGYTILRFSNYQVLKQTDLVLKAINVQTQKLINNHKN